MINLYCIRPKGFNIGNDVIYIAMNHILRETFRRKVNIISLPATSRYEAQKKAGITAGTVYEINNFGDGLIIGGGNLYENGELEINSTALRALEVPMMIFSVSRGRIYNNRLQLVDRTDVMTDENIKSINARAVLSLSRDQATTDYLKSIGADTVFGGCPTLFINEIPLHLVPISEEEKTDVLISIRNPSLMSVPVRFQYRVKEQIEQMVRGLRERGYRDIRFLCHDHRDIPFANSFPDVDYLYTEDPYTYLTYIRNTRLNLTYRLHSFLPALSFGVPAIKISYDERALSLIENIGLDNWNINMLEDSVVDSVFDRVGKIGELQELNERLRSTLWAQIRSNMIEKVGGFVDLVLRSKEQGGLQ